MTDRTRKGIAFEREVAHHLADHGWVVARLASTGGGDHGDVWAVHPTDMVMVECKSSGRGAAACGPNQWNRLYTAAMRAGATPILATRQHGRLAGDTPRIRYWRLTDRKTGRPGAPPPMDPWNPEVPS